MADIPLCPPALKAIQHYLKIAQEHESRDPVVCYWSQLYALQSGLNIDRKSDESRTFFVKMMDHLEVLKRGLKENEAITNEIAAQAHIENYALKLFDWADSQDREGNFGKNVVKAFYTSGMLFDVLTTFGELPEEVQQNRKYAKWKAAYIHNCLKNGETPIPGPMQTEDSGSDGGANQEEAAGPSDLSPKDPAPPSNNLGSDFDLPSVPPSLPSIPASTYNIGPVPPNPQGSWLSPNSSQMGLQPQPGIFPSSGSGPGSFNVPSSPQTSNPSQTPATLASYAAFVPDGCVTLTPDQMTKAQKYCKWAGSALTYDDIPTAVGNLEKALQLLKTGVDPSA